MSLTGRDIVCFSTHYWDERWFRKQEFMSRFARANRVLFVEPSFSMARRPEAHLRDTATNRLLLTKLDSRGDRVHLLKPPRRLPKPRNPRIDQLTHRWYARLVRRAMERLGFRDAILWVYQPSYLHALDTIPHERLVFDLVDDLAAYGGDENPHAPYVEALVRGLVERSDLLVVTAKTLRDRYGSSARWVEHIPNGFDAGLFSPERIRGEPGPLAGLPRPILGFIGTFFPFIDYELLEDVAALHADKSVVLVGPVEATATEAVGRLVRFPNVLHVGGQPRALIPSYVAAFDVCLNPFRKSRIADSVNPLKVYEYLAMGRPVVSTPMEALRMEDAGSEVAFADGVAEFSREIEVCLSDRSEEGEQRRRETAAPYSWEQLFERLDRACSSALAA